MFFALVAMLLLGAMNVSAEEKSLQDVPFWTHEGGWGLEEAKSTPAECAWVVGEASGLPYGDSNVNNFADLSGYEKLVVVASAGEPRFLFNRDQTEGQWDATEANSHLIDNTKGGWCSKYFTKDGNTYTVDLKQLVNDKGFAYLHAIKGANWADVTIESIVVISKGKEKQVGWINIVTNSDLEGEDISSFAYALHANSNDGNVTFPAVIEDGVGKGGSRGLSIKSDADAAETWTTQLFIVLPEVLPAGTQWRFSMDGVANPEAELGTGCHAEPRNWKDGGSALSSDFGTNPKLTTEWSTITAKGTISEDLAGKSFQSLCFDLNLDKTTATQYYFDNIKFEIYKYGTSAVFCGEVVKVDFGFETNIPELCKAAGKSRVIFPVENVKVLANGQEIGVISAEGFADGRFYIFLEEALEDNAEVQVIYNNAAGNLQLKYAGGANAGQVIPSVDEIASYDAEAADGDDIYSYAMLPPSIVSAYPEQGSFNVKKDLKEFKVKFDKNADASQIVAKLDGNALTVSPNSGYAEEFVLKYAGEDLKDGLHTINISKIYPEAILDEEVYADTTYQFSVGAPDATDVPFDLIPASYFNDCAAGSVPEGFKLFADGDPAEERVPGGNYGSGNRMMNFAAGGDFTKGLYMRTWYLTYGANDETHVLTMEAGKKYNISFNSCMWTNSAARYMKFQIMSGEQEVYSKVVEQTVSAGENANNAVKNSTSTSIDFIPEADGNYVMNWIVAKDADGTPTDNSWQNGVILANVKVSYIPNAYGVVEMLAVNEALKKAKDTQDSFAEKQERYDGAAQTALSNAIAKVEGEKDGYTSPSECEAAIELLGATSEDYVNHVNLCNDYDAQIQTGSATVDQNKETKFKSTALYGELVTIVDKYHGRSWMENVAEEGAEQEKWERKYEYDILKDEAALNAAIADLSEIVNTTAKLFTTGKSERKTTGVAALVERLRLGAEALKVLDAEDPAIQIALDALDDDDSIAEALMAKITKALYGKLKDDADGSFFKSVDAETGEESAKPFDLTVFAKNPNLYSREFSSTVPGWTINAGNPIAWTDWNANNSHGEKTAYVEDCCIYLQWHAVCNVEQTITNLPKGVYTIYFNANDNSSTSDGTYVYVKTSATPAVEDGAELDPAVNYAGYAQVNNTGWDRNIEGITVTDGQLTLGFISGTQSQPFLDYVTIKMTGKAEGVDYAKEYGDASGIEIVEVNNKAQNGVLYNIAGQKVDKSFKGIVIMNGRKFVVK